MIGDVKPVSVVEKTGKGNRLGVQITDDTNAPALRFAEEEILKRKYPFDYRGLVKELNKRFSDFKTNIKSHKIRKE